MTLTECLKDIGEETIIHLCSQGSNFFFVGNKSKLEADKEYLKNRHYIKNLGKRRVTEIYERKLGGVLIRVTGNENGDYWYENEYDDAKEHYQQIKERKKTK